MYDVFSLLTITLPLYNFITVFRSNYAYSDYFFHICKPLSLRNHISLKNGMRINLLSGFVIKSLYGIFES